MALFEHITEPTKIDVLVGFFDLTGFMQIAESLDSLELIDLLDGDFQLTGDILEETGGMLIKTIGDVGLAMYPAEAADQGVRGFFRLKTRVTLGSRNGASEAKRSSNPCRAGCVWQSRGVFEHIRSRREYRGGHGITRFCDVVAGVSEARAVDARAFQEAHAADYAYSDGRTASPAQQTRLAEYYVSAECGAAIRPIVSKNSRDNV